MTLEEALARIDELTKQNESLKGDIEKQKGIVENAEKKFKEHANELGELRKQKKAADDAVATLTSERDELKSKLEEGPEGRRKKAEEKTTESAEEIEKSMDDSQRKAVEAVYAQMSTEDKARFHEDERFRVDVLNEARKRFVTVPRDPWKKPERQKKPDANSSIAEMFDRALKRERFVPPGGPGSATRLGSGAKSAEERPVLHGGSDFLGGLKRLREGAGAGV